jgi:glycosyltransferase involved in cell wall biosynthesis
LLKIAYIANWNIGSENGVVKKIASQVRCWIREGHEAKLFALTIDNKIWEGIADIPIEVVVSPQRRTNLFNAAKLFTEVHKWKPDLVYLRFNFYYPFLGGLAAAYPLFVEINSKDVEEYSLVYPKTWYLYHILTRDLILKRATGFIFVTHEIADSFRGYNQPKMVIANGIDLDDHPPFPAPANHMPRLVFIGSPDIPWHGIEKILWIADRRQDWHFDLIGFSQEDLRNKALPNVNALGILEKIKYESVMAKADIGIGTLSINKKNMREACPLKVREYLAYGLPTIVGYRDTDFFEPVPFLLQLPSTDENVIENLEEVEKFVLNWKGKRIDRREVLKLDTKYKELERLKFITSSMVSNRK